MTRQTNNGLQQVPRRAISAGIILAIGGGTAFGHLAHFRNEPTVHTQILGVFLPLTLSFALMGAGIWLYHQQISESYVHRVTLWAGLGFLGGVAFGYPVIEYQSAHGVPLIDVRYLLLNWATTGGLGGFLVGFYDARQRQFRSSLAAERDALRARELELERQNRRLERFSSVVSHDLRNPLNVAMGRLVLAERDVESDHLSAAREALDRIEDLLEDLLALARNGRSVEDPTTVSLATIAADSWRVVETPDASLSVTGDLCVEAVPGRLQQLLENLFRNAVEHGGADVTVSVGELPNRPGFFVEDDGVGIPDGDMQDVFTDGFTTVEGGTGLGLSIVSEIVDAHGWTITATDSPTGGARFEVAGVTTAA